MRTEQNYNNFGIPKQIKRTVSAVFFYYLKLEKLNGANSAA
nr:MAG TPA: hypothetical protein [Caudoviricetes sp.]